MTAEYSANSIKTIALKELGRNDEPDFLDSNEPDIQNINMQYENILQDCLCRYSWSFAGAYAKLDDGIEIENGKFLYEFQLPSDFIALRHAYTDEKYSAVTDDYEIVRGVLYANIPTIYLNYTVRLAEEDLPASFVEWFKFRLAAELCTNVNGDMELLNYLVSKEAVAYRNAINVDSRQKGVKVVDTGVFVNCR